MLAPSVAQAKRSWFVSWAAIAAAPLIYGFLAPMIPMTAVPDPNLATFRGTFLGVSAASFALAFRLMGTAGRATQGGGNPLATRDDGLPATPAAFQLRSVIAMALFESVAVCGFVLLFLGAPLLEYWPWGLVSFAAQVGVVLPAARSYWNEVERTSGETGPIG